MDPNKSVRPVNQTNGSYIIYQYGTLSVTLTFVASTPPPAGFKVVVGDPDSGLPADYTWVQSFGIQNKDGHYLPSVTYRLEGTPPPKGKWVIYFGPSNIQDLNGTHTNVPGDPPIGYG